MIVEIVNNSDHEFVWDGEYFPSGELKCDRQAVVAARASTKLELVGSAHGVKGLFWFVDKAKHSVYVSIALCQPLIGGTYRFSCHVGAPPANLKNEIDNAPACPSIGTSTAHSGMPVGSDYSCEWATTSEGIKLTIPPEVPFYEPPTVEEHAARHVVEAAAGEGEAAPAEEAEAASFLTQTRPMDFADGLSRGFKAAGAGIAGGLASVVALPVLGAKSDGVGGFFKGLGMGVVGGAVMTVGGVASGVVQVGRGMAMAPAALSARYEEKVWDQEKGEWVDVDLVRLEHEVAGYKLDEETGTASSSGARAAEVLETEYYDLLGISPGATPGEIKKAYYKEARKVHPDKNIGDETAKAKFQELQQVYQVLADPGTRNKYDKEGKAGVQAEKNVTMDAKAFFGLLFGSERFHSWTGELNMATQVDQISKTVMSSDAEETPDDAQKQNELQRKKQVAREVSCAVNLREKTARLVYGRDPSGFEEQMRLEAHELAGAQYGPELLTVLGELYQLRSDIYLANELSGRFSVKKRMVSLNNSMTMYRHSVDLYSSAASSAYQLTGVWSAHKGAANKVKKDGEQEGEIDVESEQAKAMEAAFETALPTCMKTAWNFVVQDIDTTIKDVGRKFLQDKSVPWQIRIRRAQALQKLGQIFFEEAKTAAASAPASDQAATPEEVKAKLQEAIIGAMREK